METWRNVSPVNLFRKYQVIPIVKTRGEFRFGLSLGCKRSIQRKKRDKGTRGASSDEHSWVFVYRGTTVLPITNTQMTVENCTLRVPLAASKKSTVPCAGHHGGQGGLRSLLMLAAVVALNMIHVATNHDWWWRGRQSVCELIASTLLVFQLPLGRNETFFRIGIWKMVFFVKRNLQVISFLPYNESRLLNIMICPPVPQVFEYFS